MDKIKKIICLICIFTLCLSITSIASDIDNDTDTFIQMSFDSNEKNYLTYHTSGIQENSLPTVSSGYIGNTTTSDTLISPYAIFGSDERVMVENYSAFPYSAICLVVTTWPNGGSTIGTGWLFNKDSMMTAAHMVYKEAYGGIAKSVTVYPAYNGGVAPYGSVQATDCIINSNWESLESTSYDYAMVKLADDIGNSCGYFSYSYSATIGNNITVTGYPGDKAEDENGNVSSSNMYQWTMSGRLNTVTTRQLSYLIDTNSGQSGSPVYLTNSNVVIGIHHGSSVVANTACRITENIYQAMCDF